MAVDKTDEFTQDGEFEFQLDAVDDALDHGFHGVEADVFDDEKAQVHEDDEEVDDDELVHDLALALVWVETEHLGGFPDVEAGDDELLDAEAGHLDFLHDIVAVSVGPMAVFGRSVGPIS